MPFLGANPSEEVKEKLQKFLLDRKQRSELAASGGMNHSPPQAYRQWSMANRSPHGSMEHHSPPHNISAHYQPMFGQYDSNFPLRKTGESSGLEPNTGSQPVFFSIRGLFHKELGLGLSNSS